MQNIGLRYYLLREYRSYSTAAVNLDVVVAAKYSICDYMTSFAPSLRFQQTGQLDIGLA